MEELWRSVCPLIQDSPFLDLSQITPTVSRERDCQGQGPYVSLSRPSSISGARKVARQPYKALTDEHL
jgi:hypothetical protein